MNDSARGVLLVAPVLVIIAAISVLSRIGRMPASNVPAEAAVAGLAEAVRAAAEPSTASGSGATDAMAGPPERDPSAAAPNPTDDSLVAQVHALEDASPQRALDLARKGQALWPSGPRAAEFAASEVKALFRLGKPSEGRAAAEAMVNKYPSSARALEVEKQTGAHPYVQH